LFIPRREKYCITKRKQICYQLKHANAFKKNLQGSQQRRSPKERVFLRCQLRNGTHKGFSENPKIEKIALSMMSKLYKDREENLRIIGWL